MPPSRDGTKLFNTEIFRHFLLSEPNATISDISIFKRTHLWMKQQTWVLLHISYSKYTHQISRMPKITIVSDHLYTNYF